MADLSAPVNNGKVDQYVSEAAQKKETRGTSALGKDAFLQLLVTQMQYQDPLNPSTDTEFISQLASFSSLEQMQNLNSSFTQAQAFGLVGQEVIISEEGSGTKQGTVDFVTVTNGKTYLSIDGQLYESSKLQTVIDGTYVAKQNAPTISSQAFTYDHQDGKDIEVKINLGKDTGAASSFAVLLNGKAIDTKNLAFDKKENVVTIKKEAFESVDPGKYNLIFVFDDKLETVVSDKVNVTVSGKKPETSTTDSETEKTDSEKENQE